MEVTEASVGSTMSSEVPKGLQEMMEQFTISVLLHKPEDLDQYAADYFTKALEAKQRRGDGLSTTPCELKRASSAAAAMDSNSDDELLDEDEHWFPPSYPRGKRKSSTCMNVLLHLTLASLW